jgi:hypothetical protein
VADVSVTGTVNKPVVASSQPPTTTTAGIVQTSWAQPVTPATSTPTSVTNVPVAVTPPKPSDAYVSAGKIRWDDVPATPAPKSPVPAAPSAKSPVPAKPSDAYVALGKTSWDSAGATKAKDSTVHLKQCVEKACAGAARDIEIIEVTPRSLVIALKVASPEKKQPLTRAILSLEELDDYRVSLKWK